MIIDMRSRAFTIVELIIIITIMGTLLILGVVNLRGTQANARDSERKGDIETIATHLGLYYDHGSDSVSRTGSYPSTLISSGDIDYTKQQLRDIDIDSLTAPGITDPATTFISATNNTQTAAGVAPQPTVDEYVYQPLQSNGSLCTLESQECRKFNLYYRSEVENTVYMIKSKNQ
jgi:type II secretory pathway pseudopilin PulG